MNGPSEASSSLTAQASPGHTRTHSDVVLTARNRARTTNPVPELRRERSDGYNRVSASSSSGGGGLLPAAPGEQEPLSTEAFQALLRQVPPADITERDPRDPIRVAYFERRQKTIFEQTRRRRRAATDSTNAHREVPILQAPPRPQASTNSVSSSEGTSARTVQRHRGHASMDRPLPRPPSFEAPQSPNHEYVVPRWQPDSEASNCPICGQVFGIFFRRHHCRKCGRVVCANCSPHRITIPRQFIVHSPDEAELLASGEGNLLLDLARDERFDMALGGGQEVRLCNPCVPDPNFLPPPGYYSPIDPRLTSFPRPDRIQSGGSRRPHSYYASSSGQQLPPHMIPYTNMRTDSLRSSNFLDSASGRRHSHRHSDVPMNWTQTTPSEDGYSNLLSGYRSPFGSAPSSSVQGGWPLAVHTPRSHHRSHASTSQIQAGHRHSSIDISGPLPRSPPPPPPPIREEDECPICHYELPPKGPDGSETEREAHVSSCVQSHFSSSGPRSARLPPETAIAAAVAASGATPSQAAGGPAADFASSSTPPRFGLSMPQYGPVQRRRTTGMVVYYASEKDCTGEDGKPQECVICFEEFAVDDAMGRLECLCKFHKACIGQWWDTKGVGACPVHQDAT